MPPDKDLSEIQQLSTYSGNEDTVVMDGSNSECEENKEKESISTTASTSNSNSDSSYQETRRFNSNLPCKVIETKEMIQFRHDKLIYFASSSSESCDEGGRKLIEFNKIGSSQNFKPVSINYRLKRSNLNHFALCIKGIEPESISVIKENVYKVLVELKNLISKLNLKTLSIAKSENIENLPWSEVIFLFKKVFKDETVKIIVCRGTLKFNPEEKRKEIFEELHCSPIGGHRGVSKTYNRIKQNF